MVRPALLLLLVALAGAALCDEPPLPTYENPRGQLELSLPAGVDVEVAPARKSIRRLALDQHDPAGALSAFLMRELETAPKRR